jgi:NSS family neurotransmitter:Na+ symporter
MTGTLMTVNTGDWFASFATNEANEYSVVVFHILIVVGTRLTRVMGAKSIEMSNKIMMPVFFVIFVVLAIRVAMLPGAIEGYKFLASPDWSYLANPWCWIWAMGQAFFSLSVTGSGMIVYGAYLSKDESCVGTSITTALCDTTAALVAACVMIPACFAYGLDVGAGPSLLFVTLPEILQDIPMGILFAVILYLAMIFAGVSSLQNMFEAVVESMMFKFPRLNRKITMAVLCLLCLGIGVNMEPIYKWGPWMDIVSIYIIPLGATLGAVSWFWIMKKSELLEEINQGAKKTFGNLWHNIGKFVYVPLALILCLIALFMQIPF